MAKCSGEVYLLAIRYSAAANKSSKTFCFFSNIPCSCHFSPYSPPPRRLGSANQPPCLQPPRIHRDSTRGNSAQVESAVAGHQQPLRAVLLQPLLAGDEHRHPRAVFRRVEHLLQFVLAGIEGNFGLRKDLALAGHRIQPVDRRAAQ